MQAIFWFMFGLAVFYAFRFRSNDAVCYHDRTDWGWSVLSYVPIWVLLATGIFRYSDHQANLDTVGREHLGLWLMLAVFLASSSLCWLANAHLGFADRVGASVAKAVLSALLSFLFFFGLYSMFSPKGEGNGGENGVADGLVHGAFWAGMLAVVYGASSSFINGEGVADKLEGKRKEGGARHGN